MGLGVVMRTLAEQAMNVLLLSTMVVEFSSEACVSAHCMTAYFHHIILTRRAHPEVRCVSLHGRLHERPDDNSNAAAEKRSSRDAERRRVLAGRDAAVGEGVVCDGYER